MTQSSNGLRFLALILSFTIAGAAVAQQAPAGPDVINRYRGRQERARELTSDLLSALLQSHIQQLEDNKLTDLPLYKDLVDMRARMGELTMKMMPEVIDLLVQATDATGDDRLALINQAQGKMREVLLRLLAERERIRVRRQQAELIERLSEIIGKQKNTRSATIALGGMDEQAILAVVDSQGNVNTLYATFAAMIQDVATWSGELGAIAAESGRILKNQKVEEHLDGAGTYLMALKFNDATVEQQAVVDALEKVLAEIRKLEDPAAIDKDVVEAVKQLIKEQEALL